MNNISHIFLSQYILLHLDFHNHLIDCQVAIWAFTHQCPLFGHWVSFGLFALKNNAIVNIHTRFNFYLHLWLLSSTSSQKWTNWVKSHVIFEIFWYELASLTTPSACSFLLSELIEDTTNTDFRWLSWWPDPQACPENDHTLRVVGVVDKYWSTELKGKDWLSWYKAGDDLQPPRWRFVRPGPQYTPRDRQLWTIPYIKNKKMPRMFSRWSCLCSQRLSSYRLSCSPVQVIDAKQANKPRRFA